MLVRPVGPGAQALDAMKRQHNPVDDIRRSARQTIYNAQGFGAYGSFYSETLATMCSTGLERCISEPELRPTLQKECEAALNDFQDVLSPTRGPRETIVRLLAAKLATFDEVSPYPRCQAITFSTTRDDYNRYAVQCEGPCTQQHLQSSLQGLPNYNYSYLRARAVPIGPGKQQLELLRSRLTQ